MNRLLTPVILAVAASYALLASSCACTLVDCSDGLTVEIYNLQANELYDVTITTPDQELRCNVSTTMDPDCGFRSSFVIDDQAILRFQNITPETVTIKVERDGALLVDMTDSPEYNKLAPNGERCGPVCNTANVVIEL